MVRNKSQPIKEGGSTWTGIGGSVCSGIGGSVWPE